MLPPLGPEPIDPSEEFRQPLRLQLPLLRAGNGESLVSSVMMPDYINDSIYLFVTHFGIKRQRENFAADQL